MGGVLTSYEIRKEYLRLMGPELGRVFYALYDQCVWLYVSWLQYRTLFGEGPERIKLMNAAAGLFFRVIQHALSEEALLTLCRMTDPPVTFGHKNLTIRALPSLIEDPSLPPDAKSRVEDLLPDAQSLIDIAVTKTKFARDWRDRKLAHTDLELAIDGGKSARPLRSAHRNDVAQAMDAIAAVLNRIQLHFKDSELRFDLFSHPADAKSLLYVLRNGMKAEKQLQARLSEGTAGG